VSLKSIIRGAARVVTWPVRAPVNAAKSAAEDFAMDFVKQFVVKAVYGFLAAFLAILMEAQKIHAADPKAGVVWMGLIGLLVGFVALMKKALAHWLGVDASQTLGK